VNQVRGLYGYEQQRAAAAAAACTEPSEARKTPVLPANTTVQECTRSSSPQQDESNDQVSNDMLCNTISYFISTTNNLFIKHILKYNYMKIHFKYYLKILY
jgi:hypothetical protein